MIRSQLPIELIFYQNWTKEEFLLFTFFSQGPLLADQIMDLCKILFICIKVQFLPQILKILL